MEGLLILLLFPLAWPFIAKRIWHATINWQEMAISIASVTLLTTGVWFAGKFSQTSDIEVWNGEIVSKARDHGHYLRSYQCNCVTVSCGKDCTTTSCQTCYEDRYTVKWWARSTVGNITFQHYDRSSKSVYREPNPAS